MLITEGEGNSDLVGYWGESVGGLAHRLAAAGPSRVLTYLKCLQAGAVGHRYRCVLLLCLAAPRFHPTPLDALYAPLIRSRGVRATPSRVTGSKHTVP